GEAAPPTPARARPVRGCSKTDLRLLDSVATQTGLALENSRLAAAVAAEVAARAKRTRDLEIARAVQQRLFPQEYPPPGSRLCGRLPRCARRRRRLLRFHPAVEDAAGNRHRERVRQGNSGLALDGDPSRVPARRADHSSSG